MQNRCCEIVSKAPSYLTFSAWVTRYDLFSRAVFSKVGVVRVARMKALLIEHSCHARHCPGMTLVLSPFYSWAPWGTERSFHLPTVIQLPSGRGRSTPEEPTPEPILLTLGHRPQHPLPSFREPPWTQCFQPLAILSAVTQGWVTSSEYPIGLLIVRVPDCLNDSPALTSLAHIRGVCVSVRWWGLGESSTLNLYNIYLAHQ